MRPRLWLTIGLLLVPILVVAARSWSREDVKAPAPARVAPDRSPIDLVLTPDERWLLTANQTAHTVSLVEVATGKVCAEIPCGQRPACLSLTPDGRRVLVSATGSDEVTILELADGKLRRVGSVHVGFEPRGVVASPDGRRAYVALGTGSAVAVLDLDKLAVRRRIDVGRWPRSLAITADGKRLAVGVLGEGGVAIVDLVHEKLLYREEFVGLNLGQLSISKDQKYAYVPFMVYRHNPITPTNVRLGWVLASRIARVRLDSPARREAFSLDPPGRAISDPHGLALSPDEKTLVCAAAGTHELLVYRLAALPFQDYGGTDHVDAALLKDRTSFDRVELGGRPMAVRWSRDGKTVYVANYLLNAVQAIDPMARRITRTLALGGPREPTPARRGEAIFLDGKRSLDQWYSCQSCHGEGHVNTVAMDTRNDGRFGNFKTVLSLRNVSRTGPWFWHGWEKDLARAVKRSMKETMLGKEPSEQDVKDVIAYLDTLTVPPSPHRGTDGKLSEAARRGAHVFRGEKAGCARCHNGPHLTDGRVHNVGTGERGDVYRGYNTPSLLGIHDRILYLHDGRAGSLEELLRGPHAPERVTGRGALTDAERDDLLAYLRSL